MTFEQLIAELSDAAIEYLQHTTPPEGREAQRIRLIHAVVAAKTAIPDPIETHIIDRMVRNIGSIWVHTSGEMYCVTEITNRENNRAGYPCTIVYENTRTGEPYSRRATDWHRSMTLVLEGLGK